MNKTLLAIAGIALLAVPSLHAQGRGRGAGVAPQGGSFGGANFARSGAFNRGTAGFNRGSNFGRTSAFNGRYRGGYHGGHYGGHHGRGRYYYLGGVPYFYPFFDYGFGYPGYYSSFGFGYASPYYYGYGGPGPGYYDQTYEGAIVDESSSSPSLAPSGPSLQTAVQRQLAKRGYYKGAIDGDFGEGSRSALRRFQQDNRLKDTGRLDEATLKALGFTDKR